MLGGGGGGGGFWGGVQGGGVGVGGGGCLFPTLLLLIEMEGKKAKLNASSGVYGYNGVTQSESGTQKT